MIHPRDAAAKLGPAAGRMPGATILWRTAFLTHYAHANLEMLLSTFAVMMAAFNPKGDKPFPQPQRFQFVRLFSMDQEYTDKANRQWLTAMAGATTLV